MQKGLSEHLASLTLAGRGIHTLGPAGIAGVLNLQELEAYIFFFRKPVARPLLTKLDLGSQADPW